MIRTDKRIMAHIINRIIKTLLLLSIHTSLLAQNEKNKNTYLWINKIDQIKILDSLINNAFSYALNKNDYEEKVLSDIITKHYKLNASIDSLTLETKIQKIATLFFTDLTFGNKIPQFSYYGIKFEKTKLDIPNKIGIYLQRNAILSFFEEINNSSKEVIEILRVLNEYQKEFKQDKNKINILVRAANNYRWLNVYRKNKKIVLINIPSANLKVYENDSTLISMKLILGKKKTPTNTLASQLTQVIINPYWVVPKSIATKELLPLIKKNIHYIDHARLQVMNSSGEIISPYSINWHQLNIVNFPYTLRQSTGCDNSLGIIKLNFNSPFGIFLHDTPEKQLFSLTNRYYSHGCIRMEKPIEIAKILMKPNNLALDTIDFENCYKRPSPIIFPLPQKIPILVWYNLIDFNEERKLIFHKNIYNRNIY